MGMRTIFLLLLFAPSSLAADPPAAVVNGEEIPMAAVERIIAQRPHGSSPLTASLIADLRRAALEERIDEILLKQFLTKEKITVREADVDEQLRVLGESLAKRGSSLDAFRKESGLTDTDLRDQFRVLIGFEKFAERTGTPDELKKFHTLHKDYFDGVRVKAEALLVRVPAGATVSERNAAKLKAESISKSCQADPTAFTTYAQSIPYHLGNASIGWVSRFDSLVEETVAAAATSLAVGQVSSPISILTGFVIVKCIERTPPKTRPFDEIVDWVQETYAGSLRQVVIARQRQTATITITRP
jgi:hypothetical protein